MEGRSQETSNFEAVFYLPNDAMMNKEERMEDKERIHAEEVEEETDQQMNTSFLKEVQERFRKSAK